MNESLSILHLILNASFVVQLVMLMLIAASIGSWIVIVQRGRLLSATQKDLLHFEERFWSGIDLNDLYRECQQQSYTSAVENVCPPTVPVCVSTSENSLTKVPPIAAAVPA